MKTIQYKSKLRLSILLGFIFLLTNIGQSKEIGLNSTKICPYSLEANAEEEVVEELKDFLNHMGSKYKKGIDIFRLLHEKILGLDHHFSAMKSYQNLSSLSNPNNFPDFVKTQSDFKTSLKKDQGIELPMMLANNPILSTSFTLFNALISNKGKSQKNEDIDKIACILDFTVSMHQDIKTIYFETEYLKLGNNKLNSDLSKMFEKYTAHINYLVPIEKCRKQDDWESVYTSLDNTLAELLKMGEEDLDIARPKIMKKIGAMEFQMNQLIDLINRYALFIEQGQKYYVKFDIILNSYQNKDQCTDKLPVNYNILRKQIKETITKFDIAYNITEIKGTQLKELMFNFE